MQTKKKSLKTIDHSQSPNASWIVNMFTNINDMMNDIKTSITAFVTTDMKSIDFDRLQSFIFPGARTFTYKSASFSSGQDLVCAITYVDPTQATTKPAAPKSKTTPKTLPSQGSAGQPTVPTVAPGFPLPTSSAVAQTT